MKTERTKLRGLVAGWVCALLTAVPAAAGVEGPGEGLEAWIAEALERNPEISAARMAREEALERLPLARSLADPMIAVELMRMDSLRLDEVDERVVMVSQRLPWFGKRGARGDQAQRMADAAGLRVLELQRRIRSEVVAAHAQLWAARRAAEIQRDTVVLLQQFEAIARARYEAGDGLQADVLRAQVRLDTLQAELLTREQEAEVARARVNRLLGAPTGTPRPTGDAPAVAAPTAALEALVEQARGSRFTLHARVQEIAAREAAVREARLQRAPDIELRVGARQMSGRSDVGLDTGIALNLPWIWREGTTAGIREAEAALAGARERLRDEQDRLDLEISELYQSVDAGWRTLQLFEGTVLPRTRELVASTRSAYEAGRVTLLELVEAQKSWEDANLAYERARARYVADDARLVSLTAPWTMQERQAGLIPAGTKEGQPDEQ